MERPEVKPNDWISVGTRDAVVCQVFDSHVEVVYIDHKKQAINEDVNWADDHWESLHSTGGGYADKYTRLAEFVGVLRRGRYWSPLKNPPKK